MRVIALVGFLFSLVGCGGTPSDPGFSVQSVIVNGQERKFGLFIPHEYNKATRWPVVVFLHGALEGGNNGTSCMTVGLGPAISKKPDRFPFIAVFPQTDDHWKSDAGGQIVLAVLDKVQHDYTTDVQRVVLSGLSDGGYGTWSIGAKYPTRFSCLVPMAGYADLDHVSMLTSIPIWCFHNSGDFFVGVGASRDMSQRIKAAGGNIRYTEYDAIGHNCWDDAYEKGELFSWMLAQRR